MLDPVGVQPDQLDSSASDTHAIVMDVYRLVRAHVTAESARNWQKADQVTFFRAYDAVADEWTVYRPALEELSRTEERGGSVVGAKENLRGPRRRYIWALNALIEQLFVALRGLDPVPDQTGGPPA